MSTTITGVRVFDGTRLTGHTALRVADGCVEALGGPELLRAGDEHVDGAGGTLLPGLVDAHLHLLPGTARQAASFGVTTVLDMFSKPGTVRAAQERRERADVRSSCIGATAPGGHPSLMYAPFPYVTGPGEAAAFVADRVAEGAAHLKVLYDAGGGPFPQPSLDVPTVAALVEAGHAAGLKVVAHVSTARGAVDLLPTGVDVLAHVPFDPLTDAQVDAVAASGVAVVATLSIADGFPTGPVMPLLTRPALAERLGPAWRAVLERQATRWMPPTPPDSAAARDNTARLHRAGVTVLAGTDAPNPGCVPGASLHRELQHLVAAGLTPAEALSAATARAADVFALPDRGRLRPGAPADLLLVDGAPDERIEESERVAGVWLRGARIDTSSYVGSADEAEDLSTLDAQVQRVVAAMRELMPQFAPRP